MLSMLLQIFLFITDYDLSQYYGNGGGLYTIDEHASIYAAINFH